MRSNKLVRRQRAKSAHIPRRLRPDWCKVTLSKLSHMVYLRQLASGCQSMCGGVMEMTPRTYVPSIYMSSESKV